MKYFLVFHIKEAYDSPKVAAYLPSGMHLVEAPSDHALPEPLRTHMVALLLASSNVVGMLVSPSAPMARDAGHAARRTTQLQMVRPSSDEPATLPVA